MDPIEGGKVLRSLIDASWSVVASYNFSAKESVRDPHLRQKIEELHEMLKKVAPR